MNQPMLGIIGAGRAGTAIARMAIKAGYPVLVSNSHGPESLRMTVEILMPGATPVTVEEAASRADIVVLALPLRKYRSLPADMLAGKIVVDAMNYVPAEEGFIGELEQGSGSSSEMVQAFLPRSQLVKTLNHISYQEMEEESMPSGTDGRRALALAGNDPDAKVLVARLISDLGFDPVDAGPLSEGWRFEPGTPAFISRSTIRELPVALRIQGPAREKRLQA